MQILEQFSLIGKNILLSFKTPLIIYMESDTSEVLLKEWAVKMRKGKNLVQ